METADRQGIEDGFALATAQSTAGSLAVFGLMHELANAGILPAAAVDRIERFTVHGIHQAGASEDAAQVLEAIYRQKFAEVRRMAR